MSADIIDLDAHIWARDNGVCPEVAEVFYNDDRMLEEIAGGFESEMTANPKKFYNMDNKHLDALIDDLMIDFENMARKIMQIQNLRNPL